MKMIEDTLNNKKSQFTERNDIILNIHIKTDLYY